MTYEPKDYAPLLDAIFERGRRAREEAYGPEIGWLGSASKMDEWRSKGYEVENFWYDDRAIGWRVKGHPEEGAIVYVP